MDYTTILMLVLMGAAFYFLLIRPQQKRAKQQQEMTNALTAGSRVMLSSGIFGTVRHLGEKQAIIEIAPGIEMTVVKQAIIKTLTAADDEFEYADDSADESADLVADSATANPFDTIEPSDFTDPKRNDVVTDPYADPKTSASDTYGDDSTGRPKTSN